MRDYTRSWYAEMLIESMMPAYYNQVSSFQQSWVHADKNYRHWNALETLRWFMCGDQNGPLWYYAPSFEYGKLGCHEKSLGRCAALTTAPAGRSGSQHTAH
jgi:hypothetical protein